MKRSSWWKTAPRDGDRGEPDEATEADFQVSGPPGGPCREGVSCGVEEDSSGRGREAKPSSCASKAALTPATAFSLWRWHSWAGNGGAREEEAASCLVGELDAAGEQLPRTGESEDSLDEGARGGCCRAFGNTNCSRSDGADWKGDPLGKDNVGPAEACEGDNTKGTISAAWLFEGGDACTVSCTSMFTGTWGGPSAPPGDNNPRIL